MRRVQCRYRGVKVDEVPWGIGKHTLTLACMPFLAHWARKLSWEETAQSFHASRSTPKGLSTYSGLAMAKWLCAKSA